MRVSVKFIKTICLAAPLVFCLGQTRAMAGGALGFTVKPPEQIKALKLLPSGAWPPPEAGQVENMVKLYYLRGIFDALQFAEMDPKSAARVLKHFAGKDLHQVNAAVDEYYLKDPKRRDAPPAEVLFNLLPSKKKK